MTGWSLPKLSDGQSLWTQLTTLYSPNSTGYGLPTGTPCTTLIPEGYLGCGYYDNNVGPFLYVVPTSFTSDTFVGPGNVCFWSLSTSPPKGTLVSCKNGGPNGSTDYLPSKIIPGYTGYGQDSGTIGNNVEAYSNPQPVIHCNVFNVQVPGQPWGYGACAPNYWDNW